MTPGELAEFQQKINTDPELASAVTFHRELGETLAGEKIHQFRKTLREVDAAWKPSTGGHWLRVLQSPRNLAIAASLLLLIGFFGWWTLQTPSSVEVASQNFEQLPLQAFMNLETSDAQETRKAAHEAYIAEDYELAVARFRELTQLAPEDLNYQLYLGISQLGAGQPDGATRTLQPLAEGNDESVRDEATWYLALAFLELDRPAAALPYLDQLARKGGYRSESAQTILNDLK